MATARKKTSSKRPKKDYIKVERKNPKNGPPVYIPTNTTVPLEKIFEAVRAVLAERGKLAK
jgi:hypothetical protein